MKLSVIIPSYNEEKRLTNTLREIDKYLSVKDYDSEIIVVDGDSQDRTVEIVKEIMQEIKNLRLVEVKKGHGKGHVVRQGMLAAVGDYRLFTDADNSTSIDQIEKMWPYFKKDYGVVIGSRNSRDVQGAKQAISQPFWKRFLGNTGNLLIQILAVWGIWDTQCGFKAFTKKAAEDIFQRSRILGWAFDVEVLALAKKLRYKIAIVPVNWINSPESKVNLKGYFSFLKELFIIKWNFISRKYNL